MLSAIRLRRGPLVALAALAVAACIVSALVVRDTVTAPARGAAGRGFSIALDDPRLPRLAVAAGLLLAAIVAARLVGARTASAAVALGALLVLLPSQVPQMVRLAANADATLVLAPKEESGFRDTVVWLRAHVGSSDVLIAPKELAYYLDRGKVIPIDRDITYPINAVPQAVVAGPARYVAAEGQALEIITFVEPDWRDSFVLRRRIGSFEVYERIGSRSASTGTSA